MGSEMPWDSTGQEEIYTWCRYFGADEKALVTLNPKYPMLTGVNSFIRGIAFVDRSLPRDRGEQLCLVIISEEWQDTVDALYQLLFSQGHL